MANTHIDFYSENEISPIRQDISDRKRHYERREALYRHVGIAPIFLRDRSFLEVGPGSGYNALYTASLEPSQLVLLEPNPTGVAELRDLFEEELYLEMPHMRERVEVVQALMEDYRPETSFDFVWCEGVLSGVSAPRSFLSTMARFVAPQGLLIISCIDNVSHLSETLRRLCAQIVLDRSTTLDQQVEQLLPMFAPHLERLQGMSRRHDDWIIDTVINPASIGDLLSIADAVDEIGEEFEPYYVSPHFVQDWRWYKVITGKNRNYAELLTTEYWKIVHNFLDHSSIFPARSVESNQKLMQHCIKVRETVRRYEESRNNDQIEQVRALLLDIASDVAGYSATTALALQEVQELLGRGKEHLARELGSLEHFGGLFGHGQQCVSFTRRVP